MQRAEVGLLPNAARTSADGLPEALGAAALGLKVLKHRQLFALKGHLLICTLWSRASGLYPKLCFEQVLPMTTHCIQVGQGLAANLVHRLVPLPDRTSGGSLHQGANCCHLLMFSSRHKREAVVIQL